MPVTGGKGSKDVDAWDIGAVRGVVPVTGGDAHKDDEEKSPTTPYCCADECKREGEEYLLDESFGELGAGDGLGDAVKVGEAYGARGGFGLRWSKKAVSALKVFDKTAH